MQISNGRPRRKILRNSEEARNIRDLKASRRPRKKRSGEWQELQTVKRKKRESKEDPNPTVQAPLFGMELVDLPEDEEDPES